MRHRVSHCTMEQATKSLLNSLDILLGVGAGERQAGVAEAMQLLELSE